MAGELPDGVDTPSYWRWGWHRCILAQFSSGSDTDYDADAELSDHDGDM